MRENGGMRNKEIEMREKMRKENEGERKWREKKMREKVRLERNEERES